MSLALSVLNRAISARSCVTLATPHRCLPLEQSRALCTPADPWICAPRLTSRSSSSRPCVARCHAPGQRCLFQRSPPCSPSPVLLAAATLSSLLLGPAKLAPQCATRASLPAPAFWPTSLFLNSSATSSCKGFHPAGRSARSGLPWCSQFQSGALSSRLTTELYAQRGHRCLRRPFGRRPSF